MLLRLSIIAALGVLVAPQTSAAQAFQELYAFAALTDGYSPQGALVQGADGDFYGTAHYGGQPTTNCAACGYGTVFKIDYEGALTTLAWLGYTNGAYPFGAMIQATDVNFYGDSEHGIFRVTQDGVLTPRGGGGATGDPIQGSDAYLYYANSDTVFRSPLGGGAGMQWTAPGSPSGGLIQANDGNLYGLTYNGGTYGFGTAYKLTPSGQLTILASFGHNPRENYPVFPYGKLLQASDGNLYGVAEGGYYQEGTVFKLTLDGTLTTFASFSGTNGDTPNGGLIEANDGSFYGTTEYGGVLGTWVGTVFRLTPAGQITAVVSFTGQFGDFRGSNPVAGLVQGRDGNLYGTCAYGGAHGLGNVFRILMPGPQLGITNMAGQAVLSWRTNYTGFTLQSAPNPGGPWTDSTNAPSISGHQLFVTNNASAAAQFFRLKK